MIITFLVDIFINSGMSIEINYDSRCLLLVDSIIRFSLPAVIDEKGSQAKERREDPAVNFTFATSTFWLFNSFETIEESLGRISFVLLRVVCKVSLLMNFGFILRVWVIRRRSLLLIGIGVWVWVVFRGRVILDGEIQGSFVEELVVEFEGREISKTDHLRFIWRERKSKRDK